MKNKKYDYYRATIRRAEQLLEMHTLEDFTGFAQANHVKQIIMTHLEGSGEPAFALASKGALYVCAAAGFKSLEDYVSATENKFPDAATYYAALELNCSTFEEYSTATTHEITDATVFEAMKSSGFVDGYKRFDDLRVENPLLPKMESITNVKQLYDYAQEKGFKDFAHFLTVWQAGFTHPAVYEAAMDKGLSNAADYEVFVQGQFNHVNEFRMAKPLGIRTIEELKRYLDLNLSSYPAASFDELLLIRIITQLENQTKTPFKKLYDHFLKMEQGYKQPDAEGVAVLPKWFTKGLHTEQDVKNFLVTNQKVKLFGTYNAAKDEFETTHIKRRMVVVDGSNVAYNSNMADRRQGAFTAEMKNILNLVKKLKQDYGFEDVHVIADAGLMHRAKDKELLKDIKELCRYSESPPGEPADLSLINAVKRHHCLLVTNDNFKDWKLSDRWVEDNIDFYRLKFMLNGDIVVLPYMERFGKA